MAAGWMSQRAIENTSRAGLLRDDGLHLGEAEAIVLAGESSAGALLMDDGDGVKAGRTDGANVIRTPGIYRLAKHHRLIAAVRPKLDDLRNAGFWLRDEHYRMILKSLGE